MRISSKFTIGVHILVLIDYLGNKEKVTSNILAGSIGVNPVIVRNVMGHLKEAGIIRISQGKSGIALDKKLDEISFYDIYQAVDSVGEDGIFHFHENPNPECPVGKNIHTAMIDKLERVQQSMENELKTIKVADVMSDILKEIEKEKQTQ